MSADPTLSIALPPAVGLQVLELVMRASTSTAPSAAETSRSSDGEGDAGRSVETGKTQQEMKNVDEDLARRLSWALSGEGTRKRGVRVRPPRPSADGQEPLMLLQESDLRALDDEEGPGYTIKEGLLGEAAVNDLRREVELLREEGQLRPAGMHSRTRTRWTHSHIRGDEHMWLDLQGLDAQPDLLHQQDEATTTSVPSRPSEGQGGGEERHGGAAWWTKRPALRQACLRLRAVQEELCRVGLGQPPGPVQVQLACYPGQGARYVRHLDETRAESESGAPARKLTLLYYINPSWTRDDGGCLRLYPRTTGRSCPASASSPEGEEERVAEEEEESVAPAVEAAVEQPFADVEPRADRLLIFQSRTIEHEVLPSHAVRFSLTMWVY